MLTASGDVNICAGKPNTQYLSHWLCLGNDSCEVNGYEYSDKLFKNIASKS